jgi:hypothetical protein
MTVANYEVMAYRKGAQGIKEEVRFGAAILAWNRKSGARALARQD